MGDPVVLTDDAALGDATQRIKLLTDEIVSVAQTMGKEVALAPDNFNMPEGASPGEQAALDKLGKERELWVGKAKKAMAEAIVRTFEERRRADSDLSDDAMNAKLEELRALLSKLDILGPGLSHLSVEANIISSPQRAVPDHGSADPSAAHGSDQPLSRRIPANGAMARCRYDIAQMVRGAALPEPPLTSAPPLCGERAVDLQGALPCWTRAHADSASTNG